MKNTSSNTTREVNWILKITIIKNPLAPLLLAICSNTPSPSSPHTPQHVRESSVNERLCSFEGSSTFKLVYIWKRLWEAELQPGAPRHLGPSNAASSTGAEEPLRKHLHISQPSRASEAQPGQAKRKPWAKPSPTPLGSACPVGTGGTKASSPAPTDTTAQLLPASPSPTYTPQPNCKILEFSTNFQYQSPGIFPWCCTNQTSHTAPHGWKHPAAAPFLPKENTLTLSTVPPELLCCLAATTYGKERK